MTLTLTEEEANELWELLLTTTTDYDAVVAMPDCPEDEREQLRASAVLLRSVIAKLGAE